MKKRLFSLLLTVILISSAFGVPIQTQALSYITLYYDNYYTQFSNVYLTGRTIVDSEWKQYEMDHIGDDFYKVTVPKNMELVSVMGVGGENLEGKFMGYDSYYDDTTGTTVNYCSFDSYGWEMPPNNSIFVVNDDYNPYSYDSGVNGWYGFSNYTRKILKESYDKDIEDYSSQLSFDSPASNYSNITYDQKSAFLKDGFLQIGKDCGYNSSISATGNLTVRIDGNKNNINSVNVSDTLIVDVISGILNITSTWTADKIILNISSYASVIVTGKINADIIEINGQKNSYLNISFLNGGGGSVRISSTDCMINNIDNLAISFGDGSSNYGIYATNSLILNETGIRTVNGGGGGNYGLYCDEGVVINNRKNISNNHQVHTKTDWIVCCEPEKEIRGTQIKRCLTCGILLDIKHSYDTRTVNFFDNGELVQTQDVIYSKTATPPSLTKEGYNLSWDSDFNNVTTDLNVNAVWTKKQYTVKFVANGSVIKTQTVKHGESATAPLLEKKGYNISWNKDFNCIVGNLTVNAIYTKITCKHTQVTLLNYTDSTCTNTGYTGDVFCSECETIIQFGAQIAKKGHTFGEWITESHPTCSSAGNQYRICDVCEFTEFEELSALEHNYSTECTIDAQPTCTQNGSQSNHCTSCNAKINISIIPAYGHAFDSWKYESVPTCTVAGKIVCSCLLCDKKKTVIIEPYGHDFSEEWTVDTQPDCENAGIKSHHCTRCDVVSDETEIMPLGHSYTAVTKAPTCTERGYTEHICTACGDMYKTDFVDALGHNLTHFDKKNATCNDNGYEAYDECSVCEYTTYKEISAFGHHYQSSDNGSYTCTHCNATINGGETHTYIKTIVKATEEQDGYTQYTCTNCGYYYRTDEKEYITAPKLTINDSIVGAGKTFILSVSISNNPGIYSFTLGVDYDMDNLTLKEVRNSGTLGGELSHSKNKILWLNNTRQDSMYNGEIFQLVFEVSPYAIAQDYSISISYNAGNIINYSLDDVNLAVESGVVTVEGFTAGDMNGDNVVNNKDLVLMSEIFARNYTVYKHGKEHNDKNKIKNFNVFGKTAMNDLKNYDMVVLGVIVSRVALDCNDDGVINNRDLLTMMKYLRGEEITIK